MTDSTINTNSSEGALDVGGSVDELFGAADDDATQWGPSDGESPNGTVTAAEESTSDDNSEAASVDDSADSTAAVTDQTAADVFGQLQASAPDSGDVDDVLEDESPDDIIASADEPDPEPDVADDLLLDEGALEELLLTGRTKDKEFLWIDADDGGSTTETATDAETTTDGEELSHEAEELSHEAEDLSMIDPADVFAAGEPPENDSAAADHVPEPTETALVADDETTLPATTSDEESSSGVVGWLRSKLGGLF